MWENIKTWIQLIFWCGLSLVIIIGLGYLIISSIEITDKDLMIIEATIPFWVPILGYGLALLVDRKNYT